MTLAKAFGDRVALDRLQNINQNNYIPAQEHDHAVLWNS